MKIALLGCGEVGSCYGRAWTAAGHHIIGICELRDDEAMRARAASLNAALHAARAWLAEADIVVSAVYGPSASAVAQACLAFLRADAVYADFTTASAADMQAAAGWPGAWAGLHGRGHRGRHRPAGRAHCCAPARARTR